VTEKIPTTTDIVAKRLKHVMNPMTGLDLVRTKLVKDIEVKDGIVSVLIDIPSDHPFAKAIKEDIIDKIGPIWDIKEVAVNFTE
jgi:metal-sulfur cluster biosynthetic enzyme